MEPHWRYCQACGRDLGGSSRRPLVPIILAIVIAAAVLLGAIIGAWSSSRQPDEGAFTGVFERSASGVVRVETVSCGGTGIGTGFLVDRTTVMTSAHVVEHAVSVAISVGEATVPGTVIGIDRQSDLAVIALDEAIEGYTFSFSDRDPAPGEEVVTLGYPLGAPLSLARGTVSGAGRIVEGYGDVPLVQTDTAVNPGNSGGPLVDARGDVIGVISGRRNDGVGLGYAVGAATATASLGTWLAQPSRISPPTCDTPLGPDQDVVLGSAEQERDPDVIAVFTAYFGGINRGDYQLAWDQLGPEFQARTTLADFADTISTSYDFNISVEDYAILDLDTHRLWIRFTSLQDPSQGPEGKACTVWSMDYLMKRFDGRWRISEATGHDGMASEPC